MSAELVGRRDRWADQVAGCVDQANAGINQRPEWYPIAVAKVVVITGASGGVGRATAREFARRGDRIALLARGQSGLDHAAADVRTEGGKRWSCRWTWPTTKR